MLILVFLIVIRLPWIPTTTQPPRAQKAPRLLGHFKQVTSSAPLSWPAKDKALVTAARSAGAATASRNVSPWTAACRLRAPPGLRPPLTNTPPSSSSSRTSTCSGAPAKPPRRATSSCKRAAATTEPCRSPVTVSPGRAAREAPEPKRGMGGGLLGRTIPPRGQGDLARLRPAERRCGAGSRRAPWQSRLPAGSGVAVLPENGDSWPGRGSPCSPRMAIAGRVGGRRCAREFAFPPSSGFAMI